jgi:hypothetical protein
MYITPLSVPQKAGVIFYGLTIGVCAVVATEVALVVLAFVVLEVLHLAGNNGGGGWFVVGIAFDGFYVGIVVGAIVCWRVCRSRLRRVPTE